MRLNAIARNDLYDYFKLKLNYSVKPTKIARIHLPGRQ